MSGFKGTLGPWQVSTESPTIIKQDLTSIGLPNGGVLIGSACGHESSGFYPTDDHAIANARLIAAAPELLEALIKAADSLAYVSPSDAEAPGWRPRNEALETARAAIAKATGAAS